MAKYLRKKKKKVRVGHVVFLMVICVVLILLGYGIKVYREKNLPDIRIPAPESTTESTIGKKEQNSEMQTDSESISLEEGQQNSEMQTNSETISLGDGLQITKIGGYAGMYVEDGSDDILSDVMAIVLENTASEDLQLVRISLTYEDYTAEFEITNLPAGAKVVALEKNRRTEPDEAFLKAEANSIVFFSEPMDLREETVEITGGNGYLDVRNISDNDIPTDFYIYYKNNVNGMYFGGVTYRAKVEGGVASGEAVRVTTGHYTPESCQIVWVALGD